MSKSSWLKYDRWRKNVHRSEKKCSKKAHNKKIISNFAHSNIRIYINKLKIAIV